MPHTVYEIELKALLTKEKHDELAKSLPQKFKQCNEESILTTRYRPGDVRLRHSNKTTELVCKQGDPTTLVRKETIIPLPSMDHIEQFKVVLDGLNFRPDRPWLKHKTEYKTTIDGNEYILALQHIENFAYILEVEHLAQEDTSHIHDPVIRQIIKDLGCDPIEPESFRQRIDEYRAGKRTL